MFQRSVATSCLIAMLTLMTSSTVLASLFSKAEHAASQAASDVSSGISDASKSTGLTSASSNLVEKQSNASIGSRLLGDVNNDAPLLDVMAGADMSALSASKSADNATTGALNCARSTSNSQVEACETTFSKYIDACHHASTNVKNSVTSKINGCFNLIHTADQDIGVKNPASASCLKAFRKAADAVSSNNGAFIIKQVVFADNIIDNIETIAQSHSANPNQLCPAMGAKVCTEAAVKDSCTFLSSFKGMFPGVGDEAVSCCAACVDNEACKEVMHELLKRIGEQVIEVLFGGA